MTGSRTIAHRPRVVSLDEGPGQAGILGAKASNLARARTGGLPVIDGFVIPPALAAELAATPRRDRTPAVEVVRAAWGALSRRGADAVVVRSSSAAEDTEQSSQAGVFESVVDVHGWDDFLDAVRTVAHSAARAGSQAAGHPLAVLVQRHVDPALSGVLFTVDPVSGRTDHLAVAVVEGGPQALVSGAVSGMRLLLDRHGRVVDGPRRGGLLRWRDRVALVRLARQAETLFGGPQDIEWAIDCAGRPLLLQSRPITAVTAPVSGPVFGPGPVAETFPEALRPLEQDLWLTPLREALRVALDLTGGASRRALDRSPIVIAVDGRPAVDLDLLEAGQGRRRGLALLDPRMPLRRLRVAWQVGRLRSGLPALVEDMLTRLDRELAAVPSLGVLDDEALLLLLDRCRSSLRAAHGYELLAGTLSTEEQASGAAVALAALAVGRDAGAADAQIISRHPAVLALTAPSIGAGVVLPSAGPMPGLGLHDALRTPVGAREALRLRIRWLHELSGRAAWLLGERLTASGQLQEPVDVVRLDLSTLARAVRSGTPIHGGETTIPTSAPLPARFRLAEDGRAVAVVDATNSGDGTGAGGGRGEGTVEQSTEPSPGAVLVVDTLDPRLAPVIGRLGGLVAATGSPLSHLAILAREHGVPTVVGVADAVRRFPPGTHVVVDGASGEVRILADAVLTVEVGP
jgi:pyruvate,water dikinase